MRAAARIFEQQPIGVLQVEQHHCIGHAAFGDHRLGLGDHRRAVGGQFLVIVGFGRAEDRIGGLGLAHRMGGLFVAVVDPALVTAQLLFDLARRGIEGLVDVMRFGMTLEDQALHDMRDDIGGERAARPLAEGDMRGNGAVEILVDDGVQSIADMLLQRCAGVDLVAGNTNIHLVIFSFTVPRAVPTPRPVRRFPPYRTLAPQGVLDPGHEFAMPRQFRSAGMVWARLAARPRRGLAHGG